MLEKVAIVMLVAMAPVAVNAQTPTPPQPGPPTTSPTPALTNRLFSSDTSTYDVKRALGRFAIVDRSKGLVTEFIEKGRFNCNPPDALKDAAVVSLKATPATQQVVESSFEGSLSIFIVDANLTAEDRGELTVTDLATADVSQPCELGRQKIFEIAKALPGAQGLDVIWVSGATLSNLNIRKYSKVAGGINGAGSWLSIGAEGYKGSEKIDSVPIIALRGIIVHVPKPGEAAQYSLPAAIGRRFETRDQVGLKKYRGVQVATPLPR